MSANPETHEGVAMHEWTDFSQPDAQKAVAETLDASKEKFGHVRRNAGSFIHDFAYGAIDMEQILSEIAKNPDMALTCIDEHGDTVEEHGVICSHAECGAAKGVFDAIQQEKRDQEASGNQVEGPVTQRIKAILTDATIKAVQENRISADELGSLWSQNLVARLSERGVELKHKHVGVTRYNLQGHGDVHSASGAVVNTEPGKTGNQMEGKPEEKPFIVTVPEALDAETSLDVAARQAALATVIAFGGHGIAKDHGSFTIIVRGVSDEAAQQNWKQHIEKHLMGFKVDDATRAKVQIAFL